MQSLKTTLSPSATNMIRLDHAHTMAAFHKFHPDTSPGTKMALAKQICLALEVHATLEEEIFYPAVFQASRDSSVHAKSVPEHDEMRRLIAQIRAMDNGDTELDDTLMELMRCVIHHVADEETVLLPQAERLLGKDRLGELGAQMTRRRMALLAPRAGELTTTMVRAAPVKSSLMALGTLLVGAYLIDRLWNDGHQSDRLRRLMA